MSEHTAGAGKIRILVQLDVPEHADTLTIFQIAEGWRQSHGFEVDRGYRPVTIRPRVDRGQRPGDVGTPREDQARPRGAGLRRVILRGRIPQESISALEQDPAVLKVSRDVRLDPFAVRRTIGFDCEKRESPSAT